MAPINAARTHVMLHLRCLRGCLETSGSRSKLPISWPDALVMWRCRGSARLHIGKQHPRTSSLHTATSHLHAQNDAMAFTHRAEAQNRRSGSWDAREHNMQTQYNKRKNASGVWCLQPTKVQPLPGTARPGHLFLYLGRFTSLRLEDSARGAKSPARSLARSSHP